MYVNAIQNLNIQQAMTTFFPDKLFFLINNCNSFV